MRLAVPSGPLGIGQKFPVSNGWQRPLGKTRTNNRDKKHFAGSRSGIGRPFSSGSPGPAGPSGFKGVSSVRLPNRSAPAAKNRPGLMTRILSRFRRAAAL